MISKRLSKSELVCLAIAAVGLTAMMVSALFMIGVVMFGSSDTPIPFWCLVTVIAGFVLTAIGMKAEPYFNARRLVIEAIAKARPTSRQ